MLIRELNNEIDLTYKVDYIFTDREGQEIKEQDEVLVEHFMDVYVNDILTMKLVCIPQHLSELVLGRLLTEGIICSTDDVETLFVSEDGTRSRVILKNNPKNVKADFVETTQSCCTGNHIMNNYFTKYDELKQVTAIEWKKEWIFKLADRFAAGMPIHEKTFSTHSAFL